MSRNPLLQLVLASSFLSSVNAFCPQKGLRSFLQYPSIRTTSLFALPSSAIYNLKNQGYCVIPDFITNDLQASLRTDVASLRSNSKFNIARIGQDSTNTLNQEIRVAETCFLGPSKLGDQPNKKSREDLYQILSTVRSELGAAFDTNLDASLDELLYAYYPTGGFYRRHRDSISGSASVLRSYSLLLYLNDGIWDETKGGQLRLHMDTGGDFLPLNEKPNFIDILPQGGTLVLFKSEMIPHEVLNTNLERIAVVGWYNRAVTAADITNLAGDGGKQQIMMLAVAAALVTVGLVSILG